jgi:teichuronic acid biosynthesis glycosyltransferase TuaG
MENKKKKKIKKPKYEIDIILPNFNSSKFIDKTISSIINQSFKKWRLIIIDDASDIKTKNILQKYKKNKKIKIFFLKSNKGDGFCRIFGIKKANSKFIAFIDSDDIWKKNKLKLQLNFMNKNKYEFTYTAYTAFFKKNNFSTKRKILPPNKLDFHNFINNTSIATSSMMIRKKFIKKLKLSKSPNFEDFYLKCQILKTIKFAYCLNKYLLEYRLRSNSLSTKSRLKNLFWIWKINRKFNKLNFLDSLISLISISLNSIRKYGLK